MTKCTMEAEDKDQGLHQHADEENGELSFSLKMKKKKRKKLVGLDSFQKTGQNKKSRIRLNQRLTVTGVLFLKLKYFRDKKENRGNLNL